MKSERHKYNIKCLLGFYERGPDLSLDPNPKHHMVCEWQFFFSFSKNKWLISCSHAAHVPYNYYLICGFFLFVSIHEIMYSFLFWLNHYKSDFIRIRKCWTKKTMFKREKNEKESALQ